MAQIRFEMKLAGADRKHMAATMALAVGTVAKYEGAPGFGYEALGWRLDRDGVLHSPPIDQWLGTTDEMASLLTALADAGVSAAGRMLVQITGMDDAHAQRLSAVLISKANLLFQAFQFGEDGGFSVRDGVARLDFFGGSLDVATVKANLLFALKLASFAKKLTRVTAKERDTDNPKYAFRCFLLRLGFIGDEYKAQRKILLQNLDGNGSFKGGSAPVRRSTEEL